MRLPPGIDVVDVFETDEGVQVFLADQIFLFPDILLELAIEKLLQLFGIEGGQLLGGDRGHVEEIGAELAEQVLDGGERPVLAQAVLLDESVDDFAGRFQDALVEGAVAQDVVPFAVDVVPLLVQHVVVLEQVLAHLVIALLDPPLRALDGAVDDGVVERLAALEAEALHDVLEVVAAEEPHELVVEGDVEARRAGIALPARAPAELVVDAPRLVALRAEHEQSARRLHLVIIRAPFLVLLREHFLEAFG